MEFMAKGRKEPSQAPGLYAVPNGNGDDDNEARYVVANSMEYIGFNRLPNPWQYSSHNIRTFSLILPLLVPF